MMRLCLFALLLTPLAACGGAMNERAADIAALDGDATAGGDLYQTNCSACHGADGQGTSQGPNIVEEVAEHSDESTISTILNGEDEMPAFEDTFTDEEAADLVAFLHTL